MAKTKIADALGAFNTKTPNIVWGWSGISDDMGTVAVTVWSDHMNEDIEAANFYNGFDEYHENTIHLWGKKPGNKLRIKHLIHAKSKLGGLVRVVKVIPAKPKVEPRVVYDRIPLIKKWYKISKFDQETGQFSLSFSHND